MSCMSCTRPSLRQSLKRTALSDLYLAFSTLTLTCPTVRGQGTPSRTRAVYTSNRPLQSRVIPPIYNPKSTTLPFSSSCRTRKSDGGVVEISDAAIDALVAEINETSSDNNTPNARSFDITRSRTDQDSSARKEQWSAPFKFNKSSSSFDSRPVRQPLQRRDEDGLTSWRRVKDLGSSRVAPSDTQSSYSLRPRSGPSNSEERSDEHVPRRRNDLSISRGSPREQHMPSERFIPVQKDREYWQIQKAALKKKFGDEPWNPRKRLSPDALAGIRAIHAQFPNEYTTPVLAAQFEVSPEVIRRILKSKWRPDTEEEIDRQGRWFKRGEKIWSGLAEQGYKAPAKWRAAGVRTPRTATGEFIKGVNPPSTNHEDVEEPQDELDTPQPIVKKSRSTSPRVFTTTRSAEPETDTQQASTWL